MTTPDPNQRPDFGRRLADLAAESAQTRADHRALAGTVGEVVGTVAQLGGHVAELGADVAGLLDAVEELGAKKTAKKPPRYAVPLDWADMGPAEAEEEWPALVGWVYEVMGEWYGTRRGELVDCWALHRPIVTHLVWLRTAYVAAHQRSASPVAAAEWHTRWMPQALTEVRYSLHLRRSRDVSSRELVCEPDDDGYSGHLSRLGTSRDRTAPRVEIPTTAELAHELAVLDTVVPTSMWALPPSAKDSIAADTQLTISWEVSRRYTAHAMREDITWRRDRARRRAATETDA